MKKISNILYLALVAAAAIVMAAGCSSDPDGGSYSDNASGEGQGGSMARFTVVGDFLYTVDDCDLNVYSLENPAKPGKERASLNVGWGVETIYPFGDYLLIGSTNAMYVYSIEAPYEPEFVSSAPHFINNDPVVAIDGYAYVTLSSGTVGSAGNSLLIYDTSDFNTPRLMKTITMTRPRGLGVDMAEKKLFICDDTLVKVYDISDPLNPEKTGDSRGESGWRFDAYDVIVLRDKQHLLVVGSDGFYQFDYSGEGNLLPLGKIEVKRNKEE